MSNQRRPRLSGAQARPGARAAEALWQQALAAHRGGKLGEAEGLYRQILAATSGHAGTYNNLGLIARARGAPPDAEKAFRAALAIDPHFAEAHYNLGNALHAGGRPEDAIAAYRAAIRCRPDYRDARFNLGNRLGERGDHVAATLAHAGSLALDPDHPSALNHLGNIALGDGRARDALGWYDRACDLRPADAMFHCNRAGAYDRMNRPGRALRAALRAAALDPRIAEVHFSLGKSHKQLNSVVASIHAFRRALDLSPNHARARAQLLHQLQLACAWNDIDAVAGLVEQCTLAQIAKGEKTVESPTGVCMRMDDPGRLRAVAENWARHISSEVRALPPNPMDRVDRARLRIGYLSCSFLDHPTGHNMAVVLPKHDAERFDIVAYSYGPDDGSALRRTVARQVREFVDLFDTSDRAAAERIRADRIDILVDLNVWIDQARPAIAAHRPAPVNAAWHTPSTSGAPYMDYAFVDTIAVPPDTAHMWSECLVSFPYGYAPCSAGHAPTTPLPERAAHGLPEGAVVFASFNQTYKIDREIWRVWMDILARVPRAVLWLPRVNPAARENLIRAAKGRGIDAARLIFATRTDSIETHLDRLRLADLGLDTTIYNGHTTTFDMLRAGVPVLTVAGRGFAARVAASALTSAGLPDLVAVDLSDYVDRAIALGRDANARAALRQRIVNAYATSPLFDTPRFVRDLERAYELIWARHQAGLPPVPIRL